MKPKSFHFEVASLSDAGRVRTLNEDGVAVDGERGFAVVTDGMGGHRAGDLASRLALESMARLLDQADTLSPQWARTAVAEANTIVHSSAQKQSVHTGMGSTLAMAACHGDRIVLAHVGDSRIYRLSEGRLELLTRDDSVLNDQVEMGLIAADEVGDSRNRHFVTQALGMNAQVTAHVREEALREGDVYLLCTDGLNDLVSDTDIEIIINALKTNLPLTATHLIQLANDSGGYDNITVALLHVRDGSLSVGQSGWLSRMFGRLLN
jgi:protein phosphatase